MLRRNDDSSLGKVIVAINKLFGSFSVKETTAELVMTMGKEAGWFQVSPVVDGVTRCCRLEIVTELMGARAEVQEGMEVH